ncbi:MAG: hypothetical protein Q8K36_02405, partial [Alphaproteobacteria bacterium]|nr:hypothetical protein [Alphaproteobacteria bacterium]
MKNNLATKFLGLLTKESTEANKSSVLDFYTPLLLIKKIRESLIPLIVLMILLFSTTVTYAQLAPVTVPAGGFEIDGNLQSNTPTNGVGDWVQGSAGSGGFVFNSNGTAVDIARTIRVTDSYDSSLDNVFTGGGKWNDNPSTWRWTTKKATGKGDINNVFLHLGEAANNDQWLIIASDRLSTNGTSYIDFEFFQSNLTVNPGGSFTSSGPNNGRTNGDILVSVEYTNGGSNAAIKFYLWDNTVYLEVLPPPTVFGKTNTVLTPTPLGAFGNGTYAPYQFVEAAINITAFFTINNNPCEGATFGNILVKTKSSAAPTASLDDFVIPIAVQLNLGTAEISYNANDFCGATASVTINGVQGGTFSSSAGGLVINSTTGELNVASSTPGTYTVYYNYTTAGCTKTADVQVIIPSDSPPPTTSPIAYCVGDTASALTATGTNLLWYENETGGIGSAIAPTPSTVLAGLTTYYVSQTITNSCESLRVPLEVTINALPVVDAGSYGPVCIDAADITLVGSPVGGVWSGTGVTGNLFDPSV